MKNNKEANNKKINWKTILPSALAVVLLVALVWIYFAYIPQKTKNSGADKGSGYELLNPSRKLIAQKNLIVNFQPLRDYLNTFEDDPNISVYFEYMNTGSNISINKDAQFWPASLLKVPVAMAVAKKIERGEWKWENKLVLTPNDKDDKFGTLHKEKTGTAYTIKDLVRRNLEESDNTSNFILTRNLELKDIEDVYNHIGLDNFISASGEIGAKKYSVIFRALYNSSYLTEENSQKLLTYLSNSKFENYLASALPKDVRFAHKIGTDKDKGIYLDAGVVYLEDRPYILTVMIKADDEKSAAETMKKISEQVVNYVSAYSEE